MPRLPVRVLIRYRKRVGMAAHLPSICATVLLAGTLGAAALPAVAAPVDTPGSADPSISFGVQPASPTGPDSRGLLDHTAAGGARIDDWVAVTNYSAVTITVRVVAEDAAASATGAFTLIGAATASTEVGAWTSIGGGESTCEHAVDDELADCLSSLGVTVTLAPGERVELPVAITVPANAAPGDHAGGIAAIYSTTAVNAVGISTPLEVHAGTRVYVRVDGNIAPELAVSEPDLDYAMSWDLFAGGTARVQAELSNAGNTRISVDPVVSLSGPFGIGLGEWALPSIADLMPGQTARLDADLADVPPALLLFAEVTVSPRADDSDGAALDPIVRSSSTLAVPWRWTLLIAALGAIIIVAGRRRRRMRAKPAADRDRIIAQERHRVAAAARRDPSGGRSRAGSAPGPR